MSRLTRDGTAEPVSRDQILRRERGQENSHFPCSADLEQDDWYWHQKQTTGRGHRFESHNSLRSESSPARCSPFGAFPLLPTECFENLMFHYRPAVWHATIATLAKRSRDTLNAQQGNGREKHWHKNLGTEQVGGVGTLCVIFTAEVYNSSLIEFTRQTFDYYSRWGRTTGREHKLSERFDIGYKYKTTSWHLNGFLDGSNIGSTV